MKKSIISIILFCCVSTSYSQNIGIGTNTPHASAALEIQDTSKGILIPRMTMAQRTAIQNPAEGLMVYQTDSTKGFWYFDGFKWSDFRNIVSVDTLSTNNYKAMQYFDNPGTFTWTVPQGVKKICVELWGAGGGKGGNGGAYSLYTLGGPVYSSGGIGGNGGRGGYNKVFINVIEGQVYSINVGAAGITGNGGNNGNENTPGTQGTSGGNGGESSINNFFASGGTGGQGGFPGYKCCYQCACNGANGGNGLDANVLNYSYSYNMSQQIRSYIPVGYIPIHPAPTSNPSENGFVFIFMGN